MPSECFCSHTHKQTHMHTYETHNSLPTACIRKTRIEQNPHVHTCAETHICRAISMTKQPVCCSEGSINHHWSWKPVGRPNSLCGSMCAGVCSRAWHVCVWAVIRVCFLRKVETKGLDFNRVRFRVTIGKIVHMQPVSLHCWSSHTTSDKAS